MGESDLASGNGSVRYVIRDIEHFRSYGRGQIPLAVLGSEVAVEGLLMNNDDIAPVSDVVNYLKDMGLMAYSVGTLPVSTRRGLKPLDDGMVHILGVGGLRKIMAVKDDLVKETHKGCLYAGRIRFEAATYLYGSEENPDPNYKPKPEEIPPVFADERLILQTRRRDVSDVVLHLAKSDTFRRHVRA